MKHLVSVFLFTVLSSIAYGQKIEVSKRIDKDSIHLDFINPFYAPMEMNLTPLDSTKTFVKVKSYGLLRYRDTLKNALIIPINRVDDTTKINSNIYIKFKANFGDPNSVTDKNYSYTLPYPKGKKYKIVQTFGGKFSHNRPHSKYAIDFGTKIGDTITATRDGLVFFVKEDSNEYCKTRKCIDKGNKVLILHQDGTIANYVHLDFEGAIVEVGDQVKVGQAIGISGMTGFTTTPHLHLVIHKAKGISVPFYFKGLRTKKLRQGKYYKRKN